jgi:hypothetical protein
MESHEEMDGRLFVDPPDEGLGSGIRPDEVGGDITWLGFILRMVGGAIIGILILLAALADTAWGAPPNRNDPLIGKRFDGHPTVIPKGPKSAFNPVAGGLTGQIAFATPSPVLKWGMRNITWAVIDDGHIIFGVTSSLVSSFAQWGRYVDGFARALDQWHRASGLTFTMVADPSKAVIRIGGYPFSQPTPVLAFAQFPPPVGFTDCADCGDVCFNLKSPFWSVQAVEGVFLHEVGHSLGLHHSTIPGQVMGPSYQGFTTLQAEDKQRIRELYSEFASPPEPPDEPPPPGNEVRPYYDFDGDRMQDVWTVDLKRMQWSISRSRLGPQKLQFGSAGDVALPADYDGDGIADLAVFRPSSAQWFIARSRSGSVSYQFGGVLIDIPLVADWDGDGTIDIGVYRPSTLDLFWYSPAKDTSGAKKLP